MKLDEPSVVTSRLGFFTPLTSCVFVCVVLFISTTITVNVCCPIGISILCSICVLFISTLVSSSSSQRYVKYDNSFFPFAVTFILFPSNAKSIVISPSKLYAF